jgi:hypothetical protein
MCAWDVGPIIARSARSSYRTYGELPLERAWIRYRDANCGFYADPEGGSAASMAANECILNATADRAKELQQLTNDR